MSLSAIGEFHGAICPNGMGGNTECNWAAGECCVLTCMPGHPTINDCYQTSQHMCYGLTSPQCQIKAMDNDVWPFVGIGIGFALIMCMAICLTLWSDSIRMTGEGVPKQEKMKAWGLSVVLFTALTLLFQISSLTSDRSIAEWEVVHFNESTPVHTGIGILRGDDWMRNQIWQDAGCSRISQLAKAMMGFSLMMLIITSIQLIFFCIACCTDLLAGMGIVGLIFNIVNAVFAFILMCCFAAWWDMELCGRDVKNYDGINARFAITGWCLSFFLFIVLGGLSMAKNAEIFGPADLSQIDGNAPDEEIPEEGGDMSKKEETQE